ncbi:hypothetical protein GE253_22785 [Niveispirillum sp. SYP-B3756]|uniref:hypothetical protein n=1 Tax=Niveispirillum sp. SYP-B3756 TaxID=2662178 RepID=UPI0012914A7B|nr:hypothetical protein [Niveispirillum sp. SYP-B3756]MQP68148.1 hypothetical protein [Niveispirillum sp. SYP-B3756]
MRISSKDELRQRPAWGAYSWAAVAGGQQLAIYVAYLLAGLMALAILGANIAGWVAAPILIYLGFKSLESEVAPKDSQRPQEDTLLMWGCGAAALAAVLGAIGGAGWWWAADEHRYLALVVMSLSVTLAVMIAEAALFASWWILHRVVQWLKVRADRVDETGNESSDMPGSSAAGPGLVVPFVRSPRRGRY